MKDGVIVEGVSHGFEENLGMMLEVVENSVVVGAEETSAVESGEDVVETTVSDADAVESAGASAQFIDDGEGVRSGLLDDGESLLHFDVECAFTLHQFVRCSQPGEYSVY